MKIKLDTGDACEVIHEFGPSRAIVVFGGAYVLVDRVDADTYELSGEPARENEKPILKALVDAMKDSTTFTKD